MVVGGGMTGLLCALELRKSNPQSNITVVETSSAVGGTYKSYRDTSGNVFDHGMHLLYETRDSYVNSVLFNLLPESSWNIYEHNSKDIAGVFFAGKLQTYSPYPDIRSLSATTQRESVESFFAALTQNNSSAVDNAEEAFRRRFGDYIYDHVHTKILQGLYGRNPKDLHPIVMKLTALDRVCMFSESTVTELLLSSIIRERIAYPDQVNLPIARHWNQRALYPRSLGADQVVASAVAQLQSANVEIRCQTRVGIAECENGYLTSVELLDWKGDAVREHIDHMVWTIGWPSLEKTILKEKSTTSNDHAAHEIVLVHLALDKPIEISPLYYFYCFDQGFATFRVTNYVSYCPNAARERYYPLTVELWPSRIDMKVQRDASGEMLRRAIEELQAFKVIDSQHTIVYSRVEYPRERFPIPTIQTIKRIERSRNLMKNAVKNVSVVGVMAEEQEFFLQDILPNAFKMVANITVD